jgi:hypothetical protein
MPPAKMYKGLGWDEDKTTKRKHYRFVLDKELELEQTYGMSEPSPFLRYDL